MYVCMFTSHPSVTMSMERDSINLAKGRSLSKEFYFPNQTSKPGSRHVHISFSQLCPKTLRSR